MVDSIVLSSYLNPWINSRSIIREMKKKLIFVKKFQESSKRKEKESASATFKCRTPSAKEATTEKTSGKKREAKNLLDAWQF